MRATTDHEILISQLFYLYTIKKSPLNSEISSQNRSVTDQILADMSIINLSVKSFSDGIISDCFELVTEYSVTN